MSTTAPTVSSADEASRARSLERLGRLREGVRGIGRSRRAGAALERPMLVAGGVLIPLGVVVILLGWYGTAHTGRLFEQIPYAISGGILGGALVITGGFLYFGYWLTQLVHDGRRQTQQLENAFVRLENQMAVLSTTLIDAVGSGSHNGKAKAGAVSADTLVATSTGTMVHRGDCPVVAGKEGLRKVKPGDASLKPCKICEPYD